jgi:hypothetical protein
MPRSQDDLPCSSPSECALTPEGASSRVLFGHRRRSRGHAEIALRRGPPACADICRCGTGGTAGGHHKAPPSKHAQREEKFDGSSHTRSDHDICPHDVKHGAERAHTVGVAACDYFLKKYEACVASNVPAAQRATFQGLFDQMRNLEGACKQSAEQSKTAMSAFGCTC